MEVVAGTLHRRGTSSYPWRRGQGMDCAIGGRWSHWLTVVVHGSGLLPNVVDGLLVGCRWHCWMHCCHRGGVRGGVRGGGRVLWPHCLGGCALLLMWWWYLSGRQREDRLVEARRQAALCVHPRCHAVMVWTWPAASLTGVGYGNVPTMRVAVVSIIKTLEWRRGRG
jgi:hypothetical protein